MHTRPQNHVTVMMNHHIVKLPTGANILICMDGCNSCGNVKASQVAMALMQAQRHGADETTIRRLLLTRATLELADQVQDLGLEDGAISLRQLAGR
jgi:hypothetical protein